MTNKYIKCEKCGKYVRRRLVSQHDCADMHEKKLNEARKNYYKRDKDGLNGN